MNLKSRGVRLVSGIAAATLTMAGIAAITAPAAQANTPVTGAAFTTTNTAVDGTGHCKNGNEDVNCNIYDGKDYVWLNGGPSTAYVGDGDYFFAVLSPGGQPAPNDGGTSQANGELANLSDNHDEYTDRTFSVTDGVVSYSGPHDVSGNKIRLMPYADTPNEGGVYILAICSLADGYPVTPSKCKYDAFKVTTSDDERPPAAALTVVKSADGAYDNTYAWTISKSADKTIVKQVGGSATFTYTVGVGHDSGTVSNVTVTGTISVFNPNEGPVTGVTVTDTLSDGTECTVTGGENATIPGSDGTNDPEKTFVYSCTLDGLPDELDNSVVAAWDAQSVSGQLLEAGSADFTFSEIEFVENAVDECIDVTDSVEGDLGKVCVGDANPTEFTYSRTISIPKNDCVDYDNTATFTTNDTGATGSASATVTVCGPAKTGALTMGFWQNKNGQAIITGQARTGVCPSTTWLRQYRPFQDLSATATCSQVGTYVTNVIKAANASGASMNAMLKAQMLATALDVYFSDPALGGNKIGAPAGQPLGGVSIDLTKVCKDIAACTTYENTSSAFGGADSKTVSELLQIASDNATASTSTNPGASPWYGDVKATQELAKDTFDAINNQVAFKA